MTLTTNIKFNISIYGAGAKNASEIVLHKEDLNKSFAYDFNKSYKFTKLQSEELLKLVIDFSNSNS